jgi:AcrR family transcriptional regulator
MPTGVHIRDARQQLLDAAERILLRDGPSALTSRAVTEEAGCAKGVLHRHFADFDDFIAELVRDRTARLDIHAVAGTSTIQLNLTRALLAVFSSVTVAIIPLVTFRDDVRARLRRHGVPLLAEATALIADYLTAEREMGRIAADADVDSLALALIGAGHLLFADRKIDFSKIEAVGKIVASVMADAVQRRLL